MTSDPSFQLIHIRVSRILSSERPSSLDLDETPVNIDHRLTLIYVGLGLDPIKYYSSLVEDWGLSTL